MMVVMPTFTPGKYATECVVRGVIIRFEIASPKHMTDGIDRPRDVMSQKNPHQSAPQETEEGSQNRAFDEVPQGSWNRQA